MVHATYSSFISSFSKYLVSVYTEAGPILGAKDTTVNMADTVPSLKELISWLEGGREMQ